MVGSSYAKSIWLFEILAICVLVIPLMVAAQNCDADMLGLEIECLYYMHKGEPSTLLDPNDRCCNVIKEANIPCCCNNLNRKLFFPPGYTIGDLLDWNKVRHCMNFCGKPLAVGTKCGDFTVPPGPPPIKRSRWVPQPSICMLLN